MRVDYDMAAGKRKHSFGFGDAQRDLGGDARGGIRFVVLVLPKLA
jgi:hypothetical protein